MLAIIATCLITLPGPITAPFAPEGRFGGHWGVDVALPFGSSVNAPLDGIISHAGSVAGVRSVTIRQGAYLVSVSYLASVETTVGVGVRRGDPIGRAGNHGGGPGFHVGVRVFGAYVDPEPHACPDRTRATLRLLAPILPTLVTKD
ncbi:MAG TPA: M23 family metallopeptidase [Acidimicrobiia bacterium]|nr:M23 family metallopeptidase [Acidimicrobiia bacterium]